MIKHFNRYELKYVIDARRYHELVQDLSNFMVPDAYGDANGFYRVISLYYDSPDYCCYRSKIDGLKFRRKLRIRIYVYPGQDVRTVNTAFIEIKQRMNRTVQKRRLVLPLDRAERLCSGDELPDDLDAEDTATAAEVVYMVRALRLRPSCVVSYRRRAFMGARYERGMRLTFDMELEGRIHALHVNEMATNRPFLSLGWLVMEVKVNERIPVWAVSLLGKHECRLERVSKYCGAVASGVGRLKWNMAHKENIYG
jgi:hypothetical protein